MLIVLLAVEETIDAKGIIPSRLFRWVSNDPQTGDSIMVYGLIGSCVIVRLVTRAKRHPAAKS